MTDDVRVTFERFTDRARKAMVVATRLAHVRRLSAVGPPELLAGVGEAGGVAASVLTNLGRPPTRPADLFEPVPADSPGRLPRSHDTEAVLRAAVDTARGWGNNWVGTEHLLAGLAAGGHVPGVTAEAVAAAVRAVGGVGPQRPVAPGASLAGDDLDAMAGLADDGVLGTHWAGCHRVHRGCAVLALVGEVRRLRAAVAAERERMAASLDGEAAVWRSMGASGLTSWDIGSVLVELAAAIRRGPDPQPGGAVVSDSDRGPATADGRTWKGV